MQNLRLKWIDGTAYVSLEDTGQLVVEAQNGLAKHFCRKLEAVEQKYAAQMRAMQAAQQSSQILGGGTQQVEGGYLMNPKAAQVYKADDRLAQQNQEQCVQGQRVEHARRLDPEWRN